jgi:DNA mismatch endonuclease, patch repair protein
MADMFSPRQRSEIMSKVKGRENQATELRLIGVFREFGIRGWRRRAAVFGNPDFVFPAVRLAVFVDGCFWHGCPVHGSLPATNRRFWTLKLKRNTERDRVVGRELKRSGWFVLRIWQHELRAPDKVARRVRQALIRYHARRADRNGLEQKRRSRQPVILE